MAESLAVISALTIIFINLFGFTAQHLVSKEKPELTEKQIFRRKIQNRDLNQVREVSQSKDFFDRVKGKYIRWSTWSEDKYFIPEKLYHGKYLSGTVLTEDGTSEEMFTIGNGFKKNLDGEYWIKVN